MEKNFLILACSPRAGGNSDFMAACFAEGVQAAGGRAELIHLRDLVFAPCRACQACSTTPGHLCPLARDENDATEMLFGKITGAAHVFVAAPIFFYALPAHFKAFIDRGQRLWAAKAANPGEKNAKKPVTIGLVAGNKKGRKLFEGSLLTLRYFLNVFDAETVDACLLRGYDGPKDLAGDIEMKNKLLACGGKAAS